MHKVHNGCFYVNDTAANSDLCQSVMKSYIESLQRDAMRAKEIREGRIPSSSDWGVWNISDRD